MHAVDILIPSFDNFGFLSPLLHSIVSQNVTHGMTHVTVINNGHKDSCDWIQNPMVTVISPGKNLGWEGALKLGLEKTKAPFVMFLNDDTNVPVSSRLWLNIMLQHFVNPNVGAVGPSSNVVMGLQNIFTDITPHVFPVKFLIGFCMLLRREAIEKAGGIDDSLPGGDDLDISIRLRKAGYSLICDRNVFVYHHGFTTGNKVHGDSTRRNGWNSFEMWEKTNHALIRKHGFAEWWDCYKGAWDLPKFELGEYHHDIEGDLIRERIVGDVILDLGSGGNKTVPNAIGVDMIPHGEAIDTLVDTKSTADVVADVSKELPFEQNSVDTIICRHILEHLMDSVTVLRHWRGLLKEKGRLIIAVPHNGLIDSIPLNPEHVHAWVPESLKSLLESCGYKVVEQLNSGNGVSFITVCEKA